MPSAYDVDFVCKTDGTNPYEAITHLCVKSYDGSVMHIPLEDAIEGVRCGRLEFFITDGDGQKQRLRIARSPYARYYLTVDRDAREPRTLLNMPPPEKPEHTG